MTTPTLAQAFDLIEAHPRLARFDGPKPCALIDEIERELGIRLPSDYREFVRRYGCGHFGGEEIYGLLRRDFRASRAIPDAAWLTDNERRCSRLPPHLLLVHARDDGRFDALDCAPGPRGGRVVAWPESDGGAAPPTAASFAEFLLERVVAGLAASTSA